MLRKRRVDIQSYLSADNQATDLPFIWAAGRIFRLPFFQKSIPFIYH